LTSARARNATDLLGPADGLITLTTVSLCSCVVQGSYHKLARRHSIAHLAFPIAFMIDVSLQSFGQPWFVIRVVQWSRSTSSLASVSCGSSPSLTPRVLSLISAHQAFILMLYLLVSAFWIPFSLFVWLVSESRV
jgi:hypothetical protein